MDFDDDLNSLESRFAHLLKPIRDLQDNFNVDLAHELEEYLDQLEHAQFEFEGASRQGGVVDFAEAALLIQGSTCVYSKKVEYLYNLVYQALEAVKGRKRNGTGPLGPDGQPLADGDGAGTQPGGRGKAAAAMAARAAEEEDEGLSRFWDVEPLLKESADLDLAPSDGLLPAANASVRPPAALLALEDTGGGATSCGGGRGDGDSGVFRLQQCVVHMSGALMLDARDADMYDMQLRFIGPQPRQDLELGLEHLLAAQAMEQQQAQQQGQQQQTEQQQGQQQQMDAEAGVAGGAEGAAGGPGGPMNAEAGAAPMDDTYDDDGGGGGFGGGDWPSDDEGGGGGGDGMMGPPGGGEADAMAVDGEAEGDGPLDAAGQRTRPQRAAAAAGSGGAVATAADDHALGGDQWLGTAEEEEEADGAYDAFKPLDPSAQSRLVDRPLVVRKPRKARAPVRTAAGRDGAIAAATAYSGPALMLPEFSYYLSWQQREAEAQQRASCRGRGRAGAASKGRGGPAAFDAAGSIFDAQDAAAAAAADDAANADPDAADLHQQQQQQPPPVAYGFDDEDDGYCGGGGGGGGASDLEDDPPAGPSGLGGGADWHEGADGSSFGGEGEDLDLEAGLRPPGAGRWPGGGVPPMGFLGGSEEGRMVVDGEEPSYEELCRAHMESMMVAAAARVVQSDLARRVSNWRQRIDPVLHAEESRPAFDIQDYGERILGRLSGLKITDGTEQAAEAVEARETVVFSRVARDLQEFEVSRMFSAMLQLINNRNVALFKADTSGVPPGEVPEEPFTLQLLSTDMYHKTMGDKLAAAPAHGGGAGGTQADGGGGADGDMHDGEGENRGTQQQRGKGAARGKAGGGGGKRAKKAVAPLADANAED